MLVGEGTAKVLVSLPCSTMTAMWMLLEINSDEHLLVWGRKRTKTKMLPKEEGRKLVCEAMNKFKDGRPVKISYSICPIEGSTLSKLRTLVIDNFSNIDAALIPDPKMKLALAIHSIKDAEVEDKKEDTSKWQPPDVVLLQEIFNLTG